MSESEEAVEDENVRVPSKTTSQVATTGSVELKAIGTAIGDSLVSHEELQQIKDRQNHLEATQTQLFSRLENVDQALKLLDTRCENPSPPKLGPSTYYSTDHRPRACQPATAPLFLLATAPTSSGNWETLSTDNSSTEGSSLSSSLLSTTSEEETDAGDSMLHTTTAPPPPPTTTTTTTTTSSRPSGGLGLRNGQKRFAAMSKTPTCSTVGSIKQTVHNIHNLNNNNTEKSDLPEVKYARMLYDYNRDITHGRTPTWTVTNVNGQVRAICGYQRRETECVEDTYQEAIQGCTCAMFLSLVKASRVPSDLPFYSVVKKDYEKWQVEKERESLRRGSGGGGSGRRGRPPAADQSDIQSEVASVTSAGRRKNTTTSHPGSSPTSDPIHAPHHHGNGVELQSPMSAGKRKRQKVDQQANVPHIATV